ncbi:MAG TPA: 2,3-bisphosphoglycerate-independent phosphoglycerate mutase [Chloroflexota bacterium]|nr:2,3-bisphosphoglycerate-independent phosphoglycerate mutase [Chloroflexota bacterium]
MIPFDVITELAIQTPSKILLLVMDGLGGLPRPETGLTELASATRTNLDALARESICGLTVPVAPGITPGSGPAHLALFGYDPISCLVGRGVLSALGIGFPLEPTDLAARINFATIDEHGIVIDRRAGRISTETNRQLVQLLRGIQIPGVQVFVETESMHRAVVIFRGPNLSPHLSDTDPQRTGVPPLPARALEPAAEHTAEVVNRFIAEAARILKPHRPANYILLRGFSTYPHLPQFGDIYKLRAAAVATYPMYRGLARLVGMEVLPTGETFADEVETVRRHWAQYDFFFVHFKYTDTTGEDGDFTAKVLAIEEVDRALPDLLALGPDVIAVTGDHSTPSLLRAHGWQPVPFMLRSRYEVPDDVQEFTERACQRGTLGRFPARDVMLLLMANALKLEKYGA